MVGLTTGVGEPSGQPTCTPATGLVSGISDSASAAPAAVMASASGLRTPSYESTQLSTCESRAACFCYRFEVAEGGAALNYRV